MKVLVIGGVAAGTKAAAKLKREDGSAQVKILTKGQDISYAGCGLPYYVGGLIGTREELIVNSPEKYAGLTGAEVVTGCEVTAVNAAAHTVTARTVSYTHLDDRRLFKEAVRMGFPGDKPEEKMKDCIFTLEDGLRKEADPQGTYPQVIAECFQVFECTWVDTLDNAQDDKPGELNGYPDVYKRQAHVRLHAHGKARHTLHAQAVYSGKHRYASSL